MSSFLSFFPPFLFFFLLCRVSVLYCSLGLCLALPKTYCRLSLFLPLTFTSLNTQEKFRLVWYFIMQNIRTLHPISTKIKYPIEEDNIPKRGYIFKQTYTVKEMFGGTARAKEVCTISELPWRVALQCTLNSCSMSKFWKRQKMWLNLLWLEVWTRSLNRREKGNTLSSFSIGSELLCRSNQAESCVVQRQF